MVMIRVDNQPIVFSGQLVSYSHDSTYNEGFVKARDTRELTTPNPHPLNTFYANQATGELPIEKPAPNDTIQYIPIGTVKNPQEYRLNTLKDL